MNRTDTLYAAAKIAEAMVLVNNSLMHRSTARWESNAYWVDFHIDTNEYVTQPHHFRFGYGQDISIMDMHMKQAGGTLYRGTIPERALHYWASHILEYIHE